MYSYRSQKKRAETTISGDHSQNESYESIIYWKGYTLYVCWTRLTQNSQNEIYTSKVTRLKKSNNEFFR